MHRIFVVITTTVLAAQTVLATTTLHQPQVISFLQEAITGTWHNTKNQGVAAFVCYTDTSTLLRELSSRTSSVRISTSHNWNKMLAKIIAAQWKKHLTYIIDLTCPGVEELLLQAEKDRLLKIPNRWLLLNVTALQYVTTNAITSSQSDPENSDACRRLAGFLGQSHPGFRGTLATDSDVTLACGTTGNNVALVDMWAATPLGFWMPGRGFYGDRRPPSARRLAAGLNGREIKVAFVITRNDTLEHMDDGINIKYDTLTKFNWEVVNNVIKMLNGSLAIHFSNTYGYNTNGSWNGIVGLQSRGEAEMSGTAIAVVADRFSVVKYTNYEMPAKGVFIFRAPPMSYEHNIFAQPFPKSLWLASVGIILLCAILLYGILKFEESVGIEKRAEALVSGIPSIIISEGRKRRLGASWSDVALLTFGAVCQQGSPVEARGITGRIVTLFLFIGILFLYTSYCASIVALLQSTSTSIRTYRDFLHSKIALGVESADYNTYYMKTSNDPLRKQIYEKKIRKNTVTLEEGIKRVRTSYFAFHTIRHLLYSEIEDTFKESEKCGLVEIENFHTVQDPMMAVSNWSEHNELIVLSLRKNQERGIRHRQLKRFLTPKPQCATQGGTFQSVALIDCEAAFVVLGMGYGLSLLFLFIETLLFRYQKALNILCARALQIKST